jgi:hypothetical protein
MPGAHVNADSERIGHQLFRSANVNILGGRGGRWVEVRVVRCQFATEGC